MIETLISLGFTETDAQVNVHLVKEGPKKLREIADSLKISERNLVRTLKKLQNIGIVKASSTHPTRFSAIPFDEVFDLLIKDKIKQQQILEDSREEILSTWRKILKNSKNKGLCRST